MNFKSTDFEKSEYNEISDEKYKKTMDSFFKEDDNISTGYYGFKMNDPYKPKITLPNDGNPHNKKLSMFPFPTFRKFQKKLLQRMFEVDEKFILYQGPCGSGKSATAVTFAMNQSKTFILTSQRVLEDQYINDFGCDDFAVLKAKRHYQCEVDDACNAAEARCSHGFKCDELCDYRIARGKAMNAKVVVMNYTYFLYATYFGDYLPMADLIIYDEAHNIEKQLMAFIKIDFKIGHLLEYGIIEIPRYKNANNYIQWINEVVDHYKADVLESNNLLKNKQKECSDIEDRKPPSRFIEKLDKWKIEHEKILVSIKKLEKKIEVLHKRVIKVGDFINSFKKYKWVYKFSYEGDTLKETITFKPVSVSQYANEMLFKHGKRHLMMSATILDSEMFCYNIGIDHTKVHYFVTPSTFPPENRKIYFVNAGNMSNKKRDKNIDSAAEIVTKIMDMYSNQKGLIYTKNNSVKNEIKRGLPDRHLVRLKDHERYADRNECLNEFLTNKTNKVLISPSFSEGIDLKDDRARFIVIAKVPWPDKGDPQVKTKDQMVPDWYRFQTALDFHQVLGRGVRHEKDWCDIYILDSAFEGLVYPTTFTGERLKNFFSHDVIDCLELDEAGFPVTTNIDDITPSTGPSVVK